MGSRRQRVGVPALPDVPDGGVSGPRVHGHRARLLCRLRTPHIRLQPLWTHGFGEDRQILGERGHPARHERVPRDLPLLRRAAAGLARLRAPHLPGQPRLNLRTRTGRQRLTDVCVQSALRTCYMTAGASPGLVTRHSLAQPRAPHTHGQPPREADP